MNERDGVKEAKGRGRACRVKEGWLKERVVGTWQLPVGTANYSEWLNEEGKEEGKGEKEFLIQFLFGPFGFVG